MIKKKALLVFQHYVEGMKLCFILSCLGWEADLAGTGIDALKMLKLHSPYDLLITDLLLDEISGFALCEVAKKSGIKTRIIGVNNGKQILQTIAKDFEIDSVIEHPMDMDSFKIRKNILSLLSKNDN